MKKLSSLLLAAALFSSCNGSSLDALQGNSLAHGGGGNPTAPNACSALKAMTNAAAGTERLEMQVGDLNQDLRAKLDEGAAVSDVQSALEARAARLHSVVGAEIRTKLPEGA